MRMQRSMKPVPASDFVPASACPSAHVVDGLDPAIDGVAEGAAPSHRFLRRAWFAAAVEAYGGIQRTVVVTRDGAPELALPIVPMGSAMLGAAQVPGVYWPFRSFPVAAGADADVYEAALAALAGIVRCLRIGPVYDGDAATAPLLEVARAAGWTVVSRFIADSYLLDIAEARAAGPWPRTSTLKKNRFHEKHLAAHGALAWEFVSGPGWSDDVFDGLAQVEQASWIAKRTDGRDAKFTAGGHGAFWRAAARDPRLAEMMWAAVLRIDGRPAAFSFDINAGALKYAIANSYDPAVGKHSPGKLLYYRNLVQAIAAGATRVDWGAGDSGYKQAIGAARGPAIRDWLIFRPGAGALAGRIAAGLWRRSGG